jgi:unsaturated chondroitin disaccharide hydrolase
MKQAYEICEKKTYIHKEYMKKGLFELSACNDGNYYAHEKGSDLGSMWNWMASLTTGLAPVVFQTNYDIELIKWANMFKEEYAHKIFKTPLQTMHDIGFLYMPYSVNMWKLTGDCEHRDVAIKAADELAKRFDVRGHYIEAWSSMTSIDKAGYMIADTMMNISLLFWAWRETGHTYYYDIATEHIKTTIKYLIRSDFSVCHAYHFNDKTGEAIEEFNDCGYAVGSHWARGTAWIIYGLAIATSYTGNLEYLDIAVKLSEKFIACLTEDDFIPVWDFRLPINKPAKFCGKGNDMTTWDESDSENKIFNRDTSAAAIASCAFILIDSLKKNQLLADTSDRLLSILCEKYMDENITNPGILKCSNGSMTYTTFGDYFFMEALAKRLYNVEPCWL